MTKANGFLRSVSFSSFRNCNMIIALLLIPAGILMMIYSEKVVNFTGKFDFAENWFTSGGTYTFVKLLGLAITILAFMYLVGGLDGFLGAVLGSFLPGGV